MKNRKNATVEEKCSVVVDVVLYNFAKALERSDYKSAYTLVETFEDDILANGDRKQKRLYTGLVDKLDSQVEEFVEVLTWMANE